jgi:hypothetical protein
MTTYNITTPYISADAPATIEQVREEVATWQWAGWEISIRERGSELVADAEPIGEYDDRDHLPAEWQAYGDGSYILVIGEEVAEQEATIDIDLPMGHLFSEAEAATLDEPDMIEANYLTALDQALYEAAGYTLAPVLNSRSLAHLPPFDR